MGQFRNLVFEGGGVKGIAYSGALEVLETEGIMPEIKRVGGTSAGAITATLLAIGAGSKEIQQIVGGTSFRKFMDDSFGMIRDVRRLLEDYGWYKGEEFSRWIQQLIANYASKPELTFGELGELIAKNPTHYRRQLYVVGSNLSLQVPQVFSIETTPDVPIWYATRISMSIPLFFATVRQDHTVWVDGGVTWNYPIDLFDDLQYVDAADQATADRWRVAYPTSWGPNHIYNKQTLGFRVDTKDEIAAEKGLKGRPPLEINDFGDYAKALVGFMMEIANDAHLHKDDWHRTVFSDALGVRSTDFDLSDGVIQQLVDSGRKGAQEYFDWFNNPKPGQDQPLNR